MDGKAKKPIDIIECRYKTHLLDYFNKFSLNERKKVKYVVTDLWKTYKSFTDCFVFNLSTMNSVTLVVFLALLGKHRITSKRTNMPSLQSKNN